MHLFLELVTVVFFLLSAGHALWFRGAEGAWLFGALLLLGSARESFVVLRDVLYGFAPLSLMLGKTPLIAAVIWGYSIYLAVLWAEEMSGERLARHRPSRRWLLLVAIFMVALAGFYEPVLSRVGMARWEPGTRATAGVPWISLIGYPTLAVSFLLLWSAVLRWSPITRNRLVALAVMLPLLAVAHVEALYRLKDLLSW